MRHVSLMIAVVLTLLAAQAAPVAATTASPTLYLALGDSLAVGDGAAVPAETGYTGLMAGYYTGRAHGDAKEALNLAVGGETTTSFIAGQLSLAVAAILDPSTDVKVVTISIGGNDLLNLLNEPTDDCVVDPGSTICQTQVAAALGGVAANYPTLMGTLMWALDQDPGTERVFVLTLYNPFGGTGSVYETPVDLALLGADLTVDCAAAQSNPLNAGLNDIVACTSMAFGAEVVDGYVAIGDNALTLTHIGDPGFNIHPNQAGYAVIATAHRRAW
jgi:lysophospholipase L1-like esterase